MLILNIIVSGKFVLAAKSLLSAHQIDPEHPETHLRAVDFKLKGKFIIKLCSVTRKVNLGPVSSLSPPPSETVNAVLQQTLAKVLPDEIALETVNSLYLQRHSNDPDAILAVAEAAVKIGTPLTEIENTIFTMFNRGVRKDVKVRHKLFVHCYQLSQLFVIGFPGRMRIPEPNQVAAKRRIPVRMRQKLPSLHDVQDGRGARRLQDPERLRRGERRREGGDQCIIYYGVV